MPRNLQKTCWGFRGFHPKKKGRGTHWCSCCRCRSLLLLAIHLQQLKCEALPVHPVREDYGLQWVVLVCLRYRAGEVFGPLVVRRQVAFHGLSLAPLVYTAMSLPMVQSFAPSPSKYRWYWLPASFHRPYCPLKQLQYHLQPLQVSILTKRATPLQCSAPTLCLGDSTKIL
mgnify:FL=1